VFRYVAGKADWFANDLPREGTRAHVRRSGQAARHDVPACRPGDRVGAVWQRITAAGWDVCVVTNEGGIVLGLLENPDVTDSNEAVEEIMQPGPTTLRPDLALDDVRQYFDARGLKRVLVTTPDGRL